MTPVGVKSFIDVSMDIANSAFVRLLFPANEKSTYGLVESKQNGGTFRRAVKDDEAIGTEFIGASVEDCGSWVLQQQEKNIYIEYDTLVVLDKRSNDDHIVILAFYIRDDEFLLKGQPINTWYEFRVPYQKVDTLLDTLERPSDVFGVYFHRKNELTDDCDLVPSRKRQLNWTWENKPGEIVCTPMK
ncbi:hypothetical protein SCUP515_05228 [Seiridium cupressi]